MSNKQINRLNEKSLQGNILIEIRNKHVESIVKKICNPESDLDRSVLIEELAEPIQENGNYSCDFCSKKFNHLSNKCKHKHICKKNPNNL